nr:G2/mitotic-specific cyclin S13-7-like [Ipomoea batatas]
MEKIEDIDAGDVYNELAVGEYAEDIYKFTRKLRFAVEGVVAGGIKQKNIAAEGRNCRVLGDIGNMVTLRGAEGKQQLPQVSCHLTRGFCAQLLANAQAAAADKNKKCIGAVNVDGFAAANGETAPASSWPTLPNRSFQCRPLPVDIGRCTCVIVKACAFISVYPMTGYQAFFICLASIDAKLCCSVMGGTLLLFVPMGFEF